MQLGDFMKILVLAAGYATRLYPLTLDRPKPLLPIAGRPMLEYILKKLFVSTDISECLIVTNHRFAQKFQDWVNQYKSSIPITVMDDGTLSDADKRGAVGDMRFVFEEKGIKDDMLVIAGDNLFDFDITKFYLFANSHIPYPSVGLYTVTDKEAVKRYSVVEIDKDNRIIHFEEKPEQPRSNLVAICLYFFPSQTLSLIDRYIRQGNNPDQPGHYISWLCKAKNTYGYKFEGEWFDIGDKNEYKRADDAYHIRRANV
jgi:glucose-1-phosphate thymidylyltransferase